MHSTAPIEYDLRQHCDRVRLHRCASRVYCRACHSRMRLCQNGNDRRTWRNGAMVYVKGSDSLRAVWDKVCELLNKPSRTASQSEAATIAATPPHLPNQTYEDAPPTLYPRHRPRRSHTSLRSIQRSSSREFPFRFSSVQFLWFCGLSPARVCRIQSLRRASVYLAFD